MCVDRDAPYTYELAKKLITTDSGNSISKDILEEIYRHSRGHPFYTTALCKRINFYVDEYEHELKKPHNRKISKPSSIVLMPWNSIPRSVTVARK